MGQTKETLCVSVLELLPVDTSLGRFYAVSRYMLVLASNANDSNGGIQFGLPA